MNIFAIHSQQFMYATDEKMFPARHSKMGSSASDDTLKQMSALKSEVGLHD